MIVKMNSTKFVKEMQNIIDYSAGFLEGAQLGKRQFLFLVGEATIKALGMYIDAEARANPRALHHIYEWYRVGSPQARLYDLQYTVSNLGLSVNGTFRQSSTVQLGSYEPFYNKAKMMEDNVGVTISPKEANVLRFFDSTGDPVFTAGPVNVDNPGGTETTGSFERVVDQFFRSYFSQAFLRASGIYEHIKKPVIYKNNLKEGAKIGRAKGVQTGFRWIANVKMGVE